MSKLLVQVGQLILLSQTGKKRALREVGIENKIMSISVPVHKRLMHSISGDLTEQYYGKKIKQYTQYQGKSLIVC